MSEKDFSIKDDIILKQSIVRIINAFIKDKEKRAVEVNLYSKFFSIKIYGRFQEDINKDNCLIKALFNLCTQVYYTTTNDCMKITKELDFSEYKKGIYKVEDLSILSVDEKIDNVSFIFYRKGFKQPLNLLKDEATIDDLKSYINHIYNGAFSYLKIRCFDKILQEKSKNGILLNEDNDSFNGANIYIYRMNEYCKSCDIRINGINIYEETLAKIINWNKYPFRQKGYSFRKMSLVIDIQQNKFDMDNEEEIVDLYKNQEKNVIKVLETYKGYFSNDKIYFNVDYDKEKMNTIIKKSGCRNSIEAVKYILDNYFEGNLFFKENQ